MNSLVLFHHKIVEEFEKIRKSTQGKPEIGGILVGSKRMEHIEITSLSYPGPNDVSQLMSFIKKDTVHEKFAKIQWRLFGKTRTYMGEWHTHPSGLPVPSETDFKTWVSVVSEQKRNMVFVIISPTGWAPYLVSNDKLKPVKVMQASEEGEVGMVYEVLLK